MLRQAGTEVGGRFHVGLIVGTLSGRRERSRVLFGFEATDEMDPVSGFGTITLCGERMVLELVFHDGVAFTFECEPARETP